MPGSTPKMQLPFPLGTDRFQVAADFQALAQGTDSKAVAVAGDTMTGVLRANGGLTTGTVLGMQAILNDDGRVIFENTAFIRDHLTVLGANTEEVVAIQSWKGEPDHTAQIGFYNTFEVPTPGQQQRKGWIGVIGPNIEVRATRGLMRIWSWGEETIRFDDPHIVCGGGTGAPWPLGIGSGLVIEKESFVYFTNAAANVPCYTANKIGNGNTNGTQFVVFRRGGNFIGSITSPAAGEVSYNTTSDYRLKTEVGPLDDGLARVEALRPRRVVWTDDPDHRVRDAFFAHEVAEVVPQAVTGEKDGEEWQQLDQSKLVPTLVAAIQELSARVRTLEAQAA